MIYHTDYYGFFCISVKLAYDNGSKKHIWRDYTGEAAITKLQKLMEKPVRCYLNIKVCNGIRPQSISCAKINYAYLSDDGYPVVSFDFHNSDLFGRSPTYYVRGWGVKETKDIKVKEYHIDEDTLKNEEIVKQLLSTGCQNFDVVLEDGEVIPTESIRYMWNSNGCITFVTFQGTKYCVK